MALRTEAPQGKKDPTSEDSQPQERQCPDCAFTGPHTRFLRISECPEGCRKSHMNSLALKKMSPFSS